MRNPRSSNAWHVSKEEEGKRESERESERERVKILFSPTTYIRALYITHGDTSPLRFRPTSESCATPFRNIFTLIRWFSPWLAKIYNESLLLVAETPSRLSFPFSIRSKKKKGRRKKKGESDDENFRETSPEQRLRESARKRGGGGGGSNPRRYLSHPGQIKLRGRAIVCNSQVIRNQRRGLVKLPLSPARIVSSLDVKQCSAIVYPSRA